MGMVAPELRPLQQGKGFSGVGSGILARVGQGRAVRCEMVILEH